MHRHYLPTVCVLVSPKHSWEGQHSSPSLRNEGAWHMEAMGKEWEVARTLGYLVRAHDRVAKIGMQASSCWQPRTRERATGVQGAKEPHTADPPGRGSGGWTV
jgi:hypothetical protein